MPDLKDDEPIGTRYYQELRRMARGKIRSDPRLSLRATELANDTAMTLLRTNPSELRRDTPSRYARIVMDSRFVDFLRGRPKGTRVPLDDERAAAWIAPEDIDPLSELRAQDPSAAKAAELFYLEGVPQIKAANAMGISHRAFQRLIAACRAYFSRRKRGGRSE